MSEQITHVAVADDVRRIAMASPRIGEAIRGVLRDHLDAMRLGAVTRGSEAFAGPILVRLAPTKDAWGEAEGRKAAFCLGTMAHRAADRMMKPIFRSQAADGAYPPKDISIQQDVFLFQRVYAGGRAEPYREASLSPEVPAIPGADPRKAESLFRLLFQRALLAAHTFKPDPDEPEAWLEALFDRLQDFTVDLGRYWQLLTHPDDELMRRAVRDVNFYGEGDSIVRLAEDLRSGRPVGPDEVLERLRLGDKDSLYARMVSAGYGYLQTASELLEGRCGEQLFLDAIRR